MAVSRKKNLLIKPIKWSAAHEPLLTTDACAIDRMSGVHVRLCRFDGLRAGKCHTLAGKKLNGSRLAVLDDNDNDNDNNDERPHVLRWIGLKRGRSEKAHYCAIERPQRQAKCIKRSLLETRHARSSSRGQRGEHGRREGATTPHQPLTFNIIPDDSVRRVARVNACIPAPLFATTVL